MSLLLCSVAAYAQPKDTLYFYNHTKVVGELLRITLGRVEIDADGIGIIKVKNTKVMSMHAQSRHFRIETVDGRVVQGYLLRSDNPGRMLVQSETETREISIEDVTGLVFYGESWRSRIGGNVGAGFTYTKSSRIGRLNLNGLISYNTQRSVTQLEGDMILTYDSVNVERERESLKLSNSYSFPSLWAVGGLLLYQRNLELGLNRRLQQFLGGGRKLPISSNQQGLVLAGIALNQEQNLEGVARNNTEAVVQVNYNLYSFEKPNITVRVVQSGYFSMTQRGRVRSDGDVDISWELIADLSLSLRFYHNYDSQSPATGDGNVDFGAVTGLTFKF